MRAILKGTAFEINWIRPKLSCKCLYRILKLAMEIYSICCVSFITITSISWMQTLIIYWHSFLTFPCALTLIIRTPKTPLMTNLSETTITVIVEQISFIRNDCQICWLNLIIRSISLYKRLSKYRVVCCDNVAKRIMAWWKRILSVWNPIHWRPIYQWKLYMFSSAVVHIHMYMIHNNPKQ